MSLKTTKTNACGKNISIKFTIFLSHQWKKNTLGPGYLHFLMVFISKVEESGDVEAQL